jgi:hypothetical protein
MVMRDLIIPPETQDFAMPVDKPRDKLSVDIQTLASIRNKQYSRPRGHVAKVGNIHLYPEAYGLLRERRMASNALQ